MKAVANLVRYISGYNWTQLIAGCKSSNATSSATYTATLTVPSDPIEDYADFVITLENNQSVTLSVTENDFTSNVL